MFIDQFETAVQNFKMVFYNLLQAFTITPNQNHIKHIALRYSLLIHTVHTARVNVVEKGKRGGGNGDGNWGGGGGGGFLRKGV
jgi:hypothetical protein